MRVLLIGSGGRENAIAWSVYASPLLEKLYCIPGNPGIKEFAVCIDVNIKNYEKQIKEFKQSLKMWEEKDKKFIGEHALAIASHKHLSKLNVFIKEKSRKVADF